MVKEHNEGIVQSGGSIQAGQITVGRGAQATQILNAAGEALMQKGLEEVKEKLNELFQALAEHGKYLDRADEVARSAELVAKELAEDRPNKLTLTSVLNGITEAAKSVAGIAGAAEALKVAISAFF